MPKKIDHDSIFTDGNRHPRQHQFYVMREGILLFTIFELKTTEFLENYYYEIKTVCQESLIHREFDHHIRLNLVIVWVCSGTFYSYCMIAASTESEYKERISNPKKSNSIKSNRICVICKCECINAFWLSMNNWVTVKINWSFSFSKLVKFCKFYYKYPANTIRKFIFYVYCVHNVNWS